MYNFSMPASIRRFENPTEEFSTYDKRKFFLVIVFALISLALIPNNSLTTLFDKNSAIQFLTAIFLGSIIGLLILAKWIEVRIPPLLVGLIGLLVISVSISLALSQSKYQGITGDTFRYNGLASLFFLIIIGALHTTLSFERFIGAIKLYVWVVALVGVLSILQFFQIVTLPGIQGTVTGPFGNLDFLAAYLGTSFPLWIVAFINSSSRGKLLTVVGATLSIYVVHLTGAKQGYLDLALTAVGLASYLLYSRVTYRYFGQAMSIRLKTAIFSISIILWLEFIFSFPFLNLNLPQVSDDPQVAIRGVMWMAAFNTFKSHFFFGVGPDQYGDYYEQYRTVNSVVVLPADSTNDAHSAPLQILATYGFSGAILFVALIVLVIHALLTLHRNRPDLQRSVASLGLFLFIYLTNAAISPTVIANKYLAWAVGAFLTAHVARDLPLSRLSNLTSKAIKPLIALMTLVLILTTTFFTESLYRFNSFGEFNRSSKGGYQKVAVDNFLPCQYYFPELLKYTGVQYSSEMKSLSLARVNSSPRCYTAIIRLAGIAAEENNLKDLRKYIYQLIEIAPARREVLDAATYYALKSGDKKLEEIVRKQFAKMGITILDVVK
jgi:O-antigen ligase